MLYVEGVLLSLEGDYQQAIVRQARCAEICKLTGDKRLESDALLHLSNVYLKLGEPAIAKVYEKEAALVTAEEPSRYLMPSRVSKPLGTQMVGLLRRADELEPHVVEHVVEKALFFFREVPLGLLLQHLDNADRLLCELQVYLFRVADRVRQLSQVHEGRSGEGEDKCGKAKLVEKLVVGPSSPPGPFPPRSRRASLSPSCPCPLKSPFLLPSSLLE